MTDDTATKARWAKIPPKVRAILEANGYFKMTKEERVTSTERFLEAFRADGDPEELYRAFMTSRGEFEPDADPDPVEELREIGRTFKEATGLNADEVAEFILAQIRKKSAPMIIDTKLKAASPDPAVRTLTIRYTLTQEDGKWFMEDRDGLGLRGERGGSDKPGKEVRGFLEWLLFAWDLCTEAPDAKLSRSGRALKRRLLDLFGLEAEEDKK